MRGTFVLIAALSVASAGPVYPQYQAQEQKLTPDIKVALIKDLQNDILKVAALRAAAESIKLEEAAEDTLLEAAVDTLNEEPSPEQAEHLRQVEQLLKREKRAVHLLQGILGGSSGGGGGGGEASVSAGSDSGSILNLVGPLLGSSSGGGGGSSGGDGAGGQAAGGSDSSSILNLIGPLLGSSSGGSSGSSGGEAGGSASAGSDSSSILNLIGPLLGSSSGGSGSSGDASGGGGGSGLGSILSLSSGSSGSSSGGSSGGDAGGDYGATGGNSIIGSIKDAKFALVGDKIQLLLRVKFGVLTKILNAITHKIAALSLPPSETASLQNLKYPS